MIGMIRHPEVAAVEGAKLETHLLLRQPSELAPSCLHGKSIFSEADRASKDVARSVASVSDRDSWFARLCVREQEWPENSVK